MEFRKEKPDYILMIDQNFLNNILKDTPINDFWHRLIIQAYWTLIDYDLKNGGKLYPITPLDLAQVLYHGNDEITEELLDDIWEGLLEIHQWDMEHDNLILGDVLPHGI